MTLRRPMVAVGVFMAATALSVAVRAEVSTLEVSCSRAPADIELDVSVPASPVPVIERRMTAAATDAKRLFDENRWLEAAHALHRVATSSANEPVESQQHAQYYLAICLYRLELFQASYAIFGDISERPGHARHADALFWLAELATQLPESADLFKRVGKYAASRLQQFDNGQQRDVYWRLSYLLGRYEFERRQHQAALHRFELVGVNSEYYVKAQLYAGVSWAMLRKAVAAVECFQRAEVAAHVSDDSQERTRLRELANLSIARAYYSAAMRGQDNPTSVPNIDYRQLSAAVRHWNLIPSKSEYWSSALLEASWAYFMARDYSRALGNIHTIASPYYFDAFLPEAEILKAIVYFANCDVERSTGVVARFRQQYLPLRALLAELVRFGQVSSPESFFEFLQRVRRRQSNLDARKRSLAEVALRERRTLRSMDYVHVIEAEVMRLEAQPKSLRASPLGQHVQNALGLARARAVAEAVDLALQRYQSMLDELDKQLQNAEKLLIDIVASRRNSAEMRHAYRVTSGQTSLDASSLLDEEHMLWPFDGEYWRDELGTYRAVVEPTCERD